jgi:hypothetical protein
MTATLQTVELAVSALSPPVLDWIDAGADERTEHWATWVDDPTLARWLGQYRPTHLYLGSEFCEHLLPSTHTLRRALYRAEAHGLQPVLLTPVASPQVLETLHTLLRLLPDNSEVVVNDWGVGRLIAGHYPTLRRAAGRILCRMVKDPRLPSSEWAPQCGYGFDSPPMQALFQRLDLQRLEMDVPLFPDPEAFASLPLPKGVHLPYAFVAKGRMCRIGSLAISGTQRFAVGRQCRKECLTYTTGTQRPDAEDRQQTRHVGNTLFSRHTDEMLQAVMAATASGGIERLIAPGAPL